MADETPTDSNPYQAADAVIDGYIDELEKTKQDPEKKQKFAEEYTRQQKLRKEEKEEKTKKDEEERQKHLLDDVEFTRPPDEENEDVDITSKRNIPRGDTDAAAEILKPEALSEEDEELEEKSKGKTLSLEKLLLELDASSRDDAVRLAEILKDQKVKGGLYVLQSYFKRTYASTVKSARYLNTILKRAGQAPRSRMIILDSFFEISQGHIDQIFEEEEEEEDEDVTTRKKKKSDELSDSEDEVEIPLVINGQVMFKPDGTPVVTKMKMKQARALMIQQQIGGSSGGNSQANAIDMFEAIGRIGKPTQEQIEKLRQEQLNFYKGAAQHDSFKDIAEWKDRLKTLGVVGDAEKPSQYQKEVITEIRATGKDVFNETKEEFRPLIESLRDDFVKPLTKKVLELEEKQTGGKTTTSTTTTTTTGFPQDIEPLAQNKDEAFAVLNEAANKELSKKKPKGVGVVI